MKDQFGIWTGKRRYLVTNFGQIQHCRGDLYTLQDRFLLGSNRGFFTIRAQQFYCRRCGAQGHVKVDYEGQRLPFLWIDGARGHRLSKPKTCSLCGGKGSFVPGVP